MWFRLKSRSRTHRSVRISSDENAATVSTCLNVFERRSVTKTRTVPSGAMSHTTPTCQTTTMPPWTQGAHHTTHAARELTQECRKSGAAHHRRRSCGRLVRSIVARVYTALGNRNEPQTKQHRDSPRCKRGRQRGYARAFVVVQAEENWELVMTGQHCGGVARSCIECEREKSGN